MNIFMLFHFSYAIFLCYVVSTFKINNPDADALLKSVLMVCDVGKTSRSWSHDCKAIDDLDAAILYVCTQSKAFFQSEKGEKTGLPEAILLNTTSILQKWPK